MIPVFKPHMNKKKILPELEKILDSGWIGLGPKTKEFEDKFAAYLKAPHAVAVNSCTSALHLAVLAAGLKEGDEVLVPTMTFVSTALVLLYEKIIPVFVDSDPKTLCMDPEDARRKLTPKTRAMIPVHFGGHAADLTSLQALAREHQLILIEDCAHATGGTYHGQKLGTFGDFSCFSFHAVKNLPTADGGMVLAKTAKADAQLRKLRWLGIDKDTWARNDNKYAWRYSIEELGYKYHMNDITAVIGLAQLETLDEDNQRRAKLAARYQRELTGLSSIECPVEIPPAVSAWHNYVIKVENETQRNDLGSYLGNEGISTGVHYEPIHRHKVFQGRARMENLPVAEHQWTRLLTLPLFPTLSDQEHDQVISGIKTFLRKTTTLAV
jgi:perosamine synthetase